MEINKRIEENAALVEHALQGFLAQSDPDFGILYDAMRYAVLGGGKRIRPTLVLEFCRLYGGKDEAALPFACALELIHCYSLIHDDLPCMDNDDYRRGKLTCHRKFGEANALLAGDALLTYAFEVAASNDKVSPSSALEAVRLLSKCAGPDGMVGGQQLDLIGETERFSLETLRRMNTLKTGRLIKAACLLGCIAAGEKNYAAAEAYADGIGIAFQVCDDLLDAGTEDDKTTYLTFMSAEEARSYADTLTKNAIDAIKGVEGGETLRGIAAWLLERKK